jgi:hypothetical protein
VPEIPNPACAPSDCFVVDPPQSTEESLTPVIPTFVDITELHPLTGAQSLKDTSTHERLSS